MTAARGTPENPGTRDDVEAKFRRLAEVVLPAPRVGRADRRAARPRRPARRRGASLALAGG